MYINEINETKMFFLASAQTFNFEELGTKKAALTCGSDKNYNNEK